METNNTPINPTPVNNTAKPAANPVPVIPESEMKLPAENFNDATPAPSPKSSLGTVILLVLLVVLLGVLTVVVIWGEEIIDMFLPIEQAETAMPTDTTDSNTETSPEADINAIETELESIDFTEMESELDAIEAEIEAETASETTTP